MLVRYGRVAKSTLYRVAYDYRGIRVEHRPLPTNKSSRSSRVEFTLSKVLNSPDPSLKSFLGLLGSLIKPNEAVISRLDVAADLPVSIGDVQAVAEGPEKIGQWRDREGVLTLYYGTKSDPYQVSVYDKRREHRDRARPEGRVGTPLTRFEVRLWRLGLPLPALPGLSNPFQRLRLVVLRAAGLPFERELLVEAAGFYGLTALKGELEPTKFQALINELERSNAASVVPHPHDVFTAKWSSVSRSLLAALRIRGTP